MVDSGAAKGISGVAVVEREGLLARLQDNADVPVVVVHAGAGFGKSTLASQWARRDPRPHALVRIARFLDDPAALALALVDSLEVVGPGAGEIRGVATGAEPRFSALLLPAMSRLAATRGRPLVVVVDDVQLLTRPECHEVLHAVAEGLPEGSQLALLSRLEPPAWVARTRAEGRLLEIGARDLAFDEVEGRRLLEGFGATVSADQAADLIERAEGCPWGCTCWRCRCGRAATAARRTHGSPPLVQTGSSSTTSGRSARRDSRLPAPDVDPR